MMCIQDVFLRYFDWRPFHSSFLNKVVGNCSKVFGWRANVFLPWYFHHYPGIDYYARRKREGAKLTDAIISLTSFPRRAPYVWLVIETLLRQQMLPRKIVLYLSRDQFPCNSDIPSTLRVYEKFGILSIRIVNGDIRSHKKYWYGVCCQWWGMMAWDKNDIIRPYSEWPPQKTIADIQPRTDCFFGSGGGTYFPAGALIDANQSEIDIMRICPTADDIWLNAIVRRNGFQLVCIPSVNGLASWAIKNNVQLCTDNNGSRHYNDEQLFAVRQYFIKHMGGDPFKRLY